MKLLDFKNAADILGVDEKTIQTLCDKGELTLVPIPSGSARSLRRVDSDELNRKIIEWASRPGKRPPSRVKRQSSQATPAKRQRPLRQVV